jgi:hypothetical protein
MHLGTCNWDPGLAGAVNMHTQEHCLHPCEVAVHRLHLQLMTTWALCREYEGNANPVAARQLLQSGLRNCPSDGHLWVEYFRMVSDLSTSSSGGVGGSVPWHVVMPMLLAISPVELLVTHGLADPRNMQLWSHAGAAVCE